MPGITNCISSHQCGEIRRAVDADIIAPWVRIKVQGGDSFITVGNESAPNSNNKAAIKSFQYASSDGVGCQIEIVDEEGGSFERFFNKIMSDLSKNAGDYTIEAEWGWVAGYCGGSSSTSSLSDRSQTQIIKNSQKHKLILHRVSVRYDETFKFILEGLDQLSSNMDAVRIDATYGSDDNPMKLKDAIKKIFEDSRPPIKDIDFLRRTPSGGVAKWKFKDEENTKGTWRANQQTPLAAVREWISKYTTENDKGIKIAWDDNGQRVIFWEDANPRCNEQYECGGLSIGTFIVNGGEMSNVIEFSTDIKWNFSVAANAGGFSSPVSSENIKQDENDECNIQKKDPNSQGNVGITTMHVVSDNNVRNYGKDVGKTIVTNEKRNARANANFEPIQAQLRIQGDPSLDDPLKMMQAYCSVIVINPYHLDDNICPQWTLAGDSCHPTLSNKAWKVMGCSHEISEGSYTVTLKLFLAAPGSTINLGSTVGGSPSGPSKE